MPSRFTPPADLDRYRGFIFDCDGTLADTMPAHFQAWRKALLEGGLTSEFTWEVFTSRAGMSMERTVSELAKQFSVPLDADFIAQRQRELFHRLSSKTKPIEEVVSFAREVASKSPVAVASGSSLPNVERTLHLIGLPDLFPIIMTPEAVAHGKPAPDMFLLAAKKMGVPPAQCLVIEDGALGFEAARRAQMDFVVVDCPDPTKED